MKKIVSTICAIALFGMLFMPFVACTEVEENTSTEIKELRFDIQVQNASDAGTKAVKTAWENGDKVYLFFNLEGAKYVTLTYNGSTWEGAKSGDLSDASELGTAGTMYGVYFPFGSVAIAADGEGGVTFKGVSSNDKLNGEPIYTYYMTGAAPYTVTTAGDVSTLSSRISVSIPDEFVYFFIDKSGDNYCANGQYRLSVDGLKPVACTGYKSGSFSTSTLSSRYPIWGYAYGTSGIAFSGKIDDTWSAVSKHDFRLYDEQNDLSILTKSYTKALSSHNSVKLDVTNWTVTKRGFRGYEVSPGILVRSGANNYDLTDGSNPFETYSYYGNNSYINVYYHDWKTLRSEMGNNGYTWDNHLPSGWSFPSDGDWITICGKKNNGGGNAVGILVEMQDGSIESISGQYTGVAFAKITKDDKTYEGMLLLRDGTIIPKEGNLQHWGTFGSETNNLTYDQYLVLKDAGCLFLAATGYRYGTGNGTWQDLRADGTKVGHYWTKSGTSNGTQVKFQLNSFTPSTSSSDNNYMPVRLIQKL